MNMTLQKSIIAIVTTSFIWAQLPQAALAGADTITYNKPQVLTTLEESLNGQDEKPGGSDKLLWIIVGTLAVGALAAALGGGGGGGGGKSSSSDPDKSDSAGSVSAAW